MLSTMVATNTPASMVAAIVEARQATSKAIPSHARNNATAGSPWENMTVHNWPCVPSDGSHGSAAGLGAP